MRHYKTKEWRNFREEVIRLDGGVCASCHRGPLDSVVLQVHHKRYAKGKFPWEYPYEDCETLCKGCHAERHGLIRPSKNWECTASDDLGELSGECDLCGSSLRYVFLVTHENWDPMTVGETCCDHLTGSTAASDHMESQIRLSSRRKRFMMSPRWTSSVSGVIAIKQKGLNIVIKAIENEFGLCVEGFDGKRRFASTSDAKSFVFDVLQSGELEAFVRKQRAVT